MTIANSQTSAHSRRLGRSTAAVLLGFVAVVVLSLGTDQVLHVFKVYPPLGQTMYDTGLLLLALTFRCVYCAVGGYVTARFAPYSPMRHSLVGGVIGFVLSLVAVIAAISMPDLGPMWYPIALVVTALPCAWLGGFVNGMRQTER